MHVPPPEGLTKILQDETMTGATVNNRVQVKGVGSRKFKRQKPEDYVVVRDTHEAIHLLWNADCMYLRLKVLHEGSNKSHQYGNGVYVLHASACIHNGRSKSSGKTSFHSFSGFQYERSCDYG